MKVYRNGVSIYMGGTGTHKRAPRGVVDGWSPAAARRQRQWAWSVDAGQLSPENGIAVTLTMLGTPEDARALHRLREAFLMRMHRMGLEMGHWVIEWQERGTPHFHMALYFDRRLTNEELAWIGAHWLIAASQYSASHFGQDISRIDGSVGWLKYLAKHATRGVHHYQRQGKPEGWTSTGRLWGTLGAWPVVEPVEIPGLSNAQFYRIRRMFRAWSIADARKSGDLDRVAYLRHAGQTADKQRSRYLGAAEWVPEDVILRLVDFLERENVGGVRDTAA